MQKGNFNSAIKLLTNNIKGGILPLNNQKIKFLQSKRSEGRNAAVHSYQGKFMVQPIIFDVVDEEMVFKSAQLTKWGSGPSGIDAYSWSKILTSVVYGDTEKKKLHQGNGRAGTILKTSLWKLF